MEEYLVTKGRTLVTKRKDLGDQKETLGHKKNDLDDQRKDLNESMPKQLPADNNAFSNIRKKAAI